MVPLIFFKNTIVPYLKKIGKIKEHGADIHMEEGLAPYWYAIHRCQLRWSLREEENARNNIGGMKTMLDESYNTAKRVYEEREAQKVN